MIFRNLLEDLDNVFETNTKWLDEYKQREEYKRQLVNERNQKLFQEMGGMKSIDLPQMTGEFGGIKQATLLDQSSDTYISGTSITPQKSYLHK